MRPAIAEPTLEYRCSCRPARVARYALSRRVRRAFLAALTAESTVRKTAKGLVLGSSIAHRALYVSLDRFLEAQRQNAAKDLTGFPIDVSAPSQGS